MDNRFYKSAPCELRVRAVRHRRCACPCEPAARLSCTLGRPGAGAIPGSVDEWVQPLAKIHDQPSFASGRSAALPWLAVLLAACACAATAQTAAPDAAASAPPIALRRAQTLQAPPRGDAARQLPIILRAREMRGRPDLDASAEGDVEFRRGGMVIRADKLTYDQAEDLARATGNVVISQRRQRLQRPGAAAEGRALRGLLQDADLPFRAHRRGRQGHLDRVPRRPARGRQRRDLLELQHLRRHRRAGLDPEGGQAAHRSRGERRRRARRRAALLRRADPRLAGAQLSAQRRAQVGLPAAELRHRQQQRLPGGDPVLLEHRAESRRDLHHAGEPCGAGLRCRPSSATSSRRFSVRSTTRSCRATSSPSARATRCAATTKARCRTTPSCSFVCCASPTTTTGKTSPAS